MIADLRPISLDEVMGRAALLTRVDRKYLLPLAEMPSLIDAMAEFIRVVDIDGRRRFRYRSDYFDSPDLVCYLAAARKRRRRFKVRVRSYVDTGTQFVEVKRRGPRGRNVKQRNALHGGDWRSYAETVVDGDLSTFTLALSATYQRTTLFVPRSNSRVTIDTGIEWSRPGMGLGNHTVRLPDVAVLESKSSGRVPEIDRLLWSLHHRPVSVSKYGTGLAALRPDLPAHRWLPVLRRHFPSPPDWNQR